MLEQTKFKYVKPDAYQMTVIFDKVIANSGSYGDGSTTGGVETIYDL